MFVELLDLKTKHSLYNQLYNDLFEPLYRRLKNDEFYDLKFNIVNVDSININSDSEFFLSFNPELVTRLSTISKYGK